MVGRQVLAAILIALLAFPAWAYPSDRPGDRETTPNVNCCQAERNIRGLTDAEKMAAVSPFQLP
jgi:hypothetical protein